MIEYYVSGALSWVASISPLVSISAARKGVVSMVRTC